jgi:hypothetical protein
MKMQDGNRLKTWARAVVLLAIVLLAVSQFRVERAGLDLAVTERGLTFRLTSAFIRIAFDIGQECSKSNSCGRVF